jgi:predicted ester cyclase
MRPPRFTQSIIGWALDLPLTSKPAHVVSGQATSTMSAEQTQATMEAYVAALLRGDDVEAFFADDIVVTFVGIGRVVKGRTRGKQAITRLLHGQFDAELEIRHLMVGPGRASHEVARIGAHLWEVAGIPPNGGSVDILHSVFYELADGKITALRVHGLTDDLYRRRLVIPGYVAVTNDDAVSSDY